MYQNKCICRDEVVGGLIFADLEKIDEMWGLFYMNEIIFFNELKAWWGWESKITN